MKAEEACRKTIGIAKGAVNTMVLAVILLLLAFAGYALWDSNQIHELADKSHYAVYKPAAADEGKSFQELQALNAEVFAWLSVYGTNIDYPVTQGQDNMKYVNTNAQGLYSLSGSIFLDCGNSKDFSDFNSILFGHHMEKKKMFGEIGSFSDSAMFDSRRYGNLYFDGEDHGIEFFAFVHTDAYDSAVFTPNVKGEMRRAYLDNLLAKAIYKRDIGIAAEDHIVLLATCSSSSTNGRDILAGRITGRVYENSFLSTDTDDWKKPVGADRQSGFLREPLQRAMLVLLCAALPAACILVIYYKRHKRAQKRGRDRWWIKH